MKAWKTSTNLVLLLGVTFVLYPPTVHAYLDPGSGSMLLQILLGGFAAIGVISKLYWHRLTSVFRRKGLQSDGR